MLTDLQLRQRADELRQQLKMTMRQTTAAITTSMQLIEDIAQRRHGESLEDHFAKTAEIVLRTRERLDLRAY